MKSSRKTFAELQAWLDTCDTPDAQTLADFLGIELATEPETPVGQRRRSPGGVEVIKTDDWKTLWRRQQGTVGRSWFADAEVADWEIVLEP